MDREQKHALVEELTKTLGTAPLLAVADYRGVTVAEINLLRRNLEKAGIQYKVIKNSLAGLAVAGTDREGLTQHLTGMVGWIISSEDPINTAKVLRDVTKDFKKTERFVIKAGYFDGEVIDASGVEKVADLPGREELLGTLLATLQQGPRNVLGVVQGPARDLMYLLKNYEQKLEEAGG